MAGGVGGVMEVAEKKYELSEGEYAACEIAVDSAYERLKEPLGGALKKITDSIHESLHNYLMDWMECDLQSNFVSLVLERAERIISGLFNGNYDETTAKQWLQNYDFEKYREAVARNYPQLITDKLVSELMDENKRLKEQLKWARR